MPLIILLLILFSSCEKVVTIDVGTSTKQYVIEAVIADNDSSCRVNLSQTLNFNDSNQFIGVNGANITITEDGRVPVKLNQVEAGIYKAKFTGKVGHAYHLNISTNSKIYEANSVMPQKVYIDSLYVTERLFLGKTRKFATVEFSDIPGLGNAYRLIQYVDGRKENTIFVTDDNLIDGRRVVYDLLVFGDDDYGLKAGQKLKVELLSISPGIYKYWYSLSQSALGQSQSASPGNPLNEFGNGAIGYFSAQTYDVKVIDVK